MPTSAGWLHLSGKDGSDANRLAPGSLRDFQALADEAFRDMLRKYNRPSDLGAAMKQRAGSARRPKRPGPRAR